ncbi:alpha/beta hydrolase-fold protein [Acidicapsa acidisoli]|uniref:alpha/beta hydrolase-fold protein n=1 Tax=Acidicapsa acidisoli TaxID=1615681 RepID=UPI0021DF7230|nr:alpha/beta hydrolase-fold protein [Acidicapsa acidisoli]
MRSVLLFCIFVATTAWAQQSLKINEPVGRELSSGSVESYAIALKAGDYVAGLLDQHGTTDLTILAPDGSPVRHYPGPVEGGKRLWVLIADTPGTYRIEATTSAAQPVRFELTLTQVLSLDERLKPKPWQDPNPSPRMEALRKQAAAGKFDHEAFWKQVTAEGTPLVESIEKDPQHQLVTFLWRGTPQTRNVFPIGSFKVGGLYPLDYVFHQIPSTDVWYLTVRLPTGARFTYGLSENDPLVFNGFQPERFATTQVDPLNPHRWGCAPDATRYDCQSMAENKGAVPQPWIIKNPSIAAGTIEKQKIHSELLKNDHDLSIYIPAGYKANATPYDLVVIFDESAYLTKVPTPVILDNLIAASKIPPTVAVLIANPSQASRNAELTPNPKFADFLAKELVPWIHAHYNVTNDPGSVVVAGSSLGGLAATYAGYRHPEVFGNALCQSGSFWWAPDHSGAIPDGVTTETGWMAKQFIASPTLPLRFYMDAGVFEYDSNGTGGGILETSRDMRDVLLAKGYEVHYQQFVGGHDYLSWRGTFADGLMDLIGTTKNVP